MSRNDKGTNKAGTRSTHRVGMVGEGHFIAWASRQHWDVYRGLDGHTRCDYVIDTGIDLWRVEVKRAETEHRSENNYYYVSCPRLDASKFDFLFLSTPVGCYWIPATSCPRSVLSVKVVGGEYDRNITRPGKWEPYRVELV